MLALSLALSLPAAAQLLLQSPAKKSTMILCTILFSIRFLLVEQGSVRSGLLSMSTEPGERGNGRERKKNIAFAMVSERVDEEMVRAPHRLPMGPI